MINQLKSSFEYLTMVFKVIKTNYNLYNIMYNIILGTLTELAKLKITNQISRILFGPMNRDEVIIKTANKKPYGYQKLPPVL